MTALFWGAAWVFGVFYALCLLVEAVAWVVYGIYRLLKEVR